MVLPLRLVELSVAKVLCLCQHVNDEVYNTELFKGASWEERGSNVKDIRP